MLPAPAGAASRGDSLLSTRIDFYGNNDRGVLIGACSARCDEPVGIPGPVRAAYPRPSAREPQPVPTANRDLARPYARRPHDVPDTRIPCRRWGTGSSAGGTPGAVGLDGRREDGLAVSSGVCFALLASGKSKRSVELSFLKC